MTFNRRQIIKMGLGTLLLPSCFRQEANLSLPLKKSDLLYFGYGSLQDPSKVGVVVYDFAKSKTFPLDNEIHSVAYSPSLDIKVLMPKIGNTSYFQKGNEDLTPFASVSGKYFYGHGAIDEKRGLLYTTQASSKSELQRDQMDDAGEIIIHSLKDFKVIGSFSSFGNNPHDLCIVGDELIVCNGGAHSNVAFISLADHKLVKTFALNEQPHISFGHLTVIDQNNFVIASGSRHKSLPCPLYLLNRETGLKQTEIPNGSEADFIGQLLSVTHHQDIIYATCPASHRLFTWNKDGQFLSALTINQASSLAYSDSLKGMLVGSGDQPQKLKLVKNTGRIFTMQELDGESLPTGAHSLLVRANG